MATATMEKMGPNDDFCRLSPLILVGDCKVHPEAIDKVVSTTHYQPGALPRSEHIYALSSFILGPLWL
jgi:hypothetical protein